MARELKVPVICLSQLNRAAEQREGHRPRMSDLRESGSIEQDADVVMFIHRPEKIYTEDEWIREYGDAEPYPRGVAQIIISKNRNGPTGEVMLRFIQETTKFENNIVEVGSSGF